MNQYDRYASREEIARNNARAAANELRRQQESCAKLQRIINSRMETMNMKQLLLLADVSYDIDDYAMFFEVLKKIK